MARERLDQCLLITATLLGSWLGMQAVHEAGHVLGAWATGGRVAKVVLHPLTISRTELADNPHPLAVVWAGPVLGVLIPLAVWGGATACRCPSRYLLRFFAGFCLIANGVYIGMGIIDPVGDAAEMLQLGSPQWLLAGFGIAATPVGLCLWHGLGVHFGLGGSPRRVSRRAAYVAVAGVVVLLALEVLWGGE